MSAKEQARLRRHRWALGRHYLSCTVAGPSWSQVSFLLGNLGISGDPIFPPPSLHTTAIMSLTASRKTFHVFWVTEERPHDHRVLGPGMVLLSCVSPPSTAPLHCNCRPKQTCEEREQRGPALRGEHREAAIQHLGRLHADGPGDFASFYL